jgi:hypothetical protein
MVAALAHRTGYVMSHVMTISIATSLILSRPDLMPGLSKKEAEKQHFGGSIIAYQPSFDGSISKVNFGAVPTDKLHPWI